jgi:hypothetical protein
VRVDNDRRHFEKKDLETIPRQTEDISVNKSVEEEDSELEERH